MSTSATRSGSLRKRGARRAGSRTSTATLRWNSRSLGSTSPSSSLARAASITPSRIRRPSSSSEASAGCSSRARSDPFKPGTSSTRLPGRKYVFVGAAREAGVILDGWCRRKPGLWISSVGARGALRRVWRRRDLTGTRCMRRRSDSGDNARRTGRLPRGVTPFNSSPWVTFPNTGAAEGPSARLTDLLCELVQTPILPTVEGEMTRDLWSLPGEGEHIWFVNALVTIKVPGEAVDGRMTMIEFLMPKGASPPRHFHPQDETFTMIDGTLTFVAGDQRFVCEAGANWIVPSGVEHTFRVESETAKLVAVYAPAGMDDCFRDAGMPADQSHPAAARTRRPDHSTRSKRSWPPTITTMSAHQWGRTTRRRRAGSRHHVRDT